MNIQTIIACVLIVSGFLLYRYKRTRQPPTYDAAEQIEAIRQLYVLADQLENADRMLADLNACSPRSLLRGFQALWCGIDGRQRSIQLFADGRNRATTGLRDAAQEERERVNAEIIATIRAMNAALDAGTAPALTLDVVDDTVDGTSVSDYMGEC